MRATATISKANHYFRINGFYEEFAVRVILPFCKLNLCKMAKKPIPGTRKQAWFVQHVFARSNYDKSEYRLPIETLKEFVEFAGYRGYKESRLKIQDEPEIEGKDVVFEFNPGFDQFREGQGEWIEYMLSDGHLKVNNASTGFGKTYMAIHSMVKIGKRTLITMQPRYQINWIRELNKIVKLIPGDLLIWENTLESLYECLEDGKFDPKIIIIPMSRIEVFLRKGKETRDGLHMDDLIKRINPGLRIIDEGHEAIHQIFLSLMFGNIKKLFLLSATLKADDPFTNKMYQYLFPKRLRLKEAEPEHYIDVVAYLYRLNTRRYHLKTDQFGAYNDKTFEKSILKSGVLLAFYFKLVNKAFKEYYLNVRREGTKCLFFFSRVNMCDAMLELFRKEYPGWDFETFTGDDSKLKDKKDKYLKHEIIITTPNSCGTGKDIGGLVTVICAHTVASTQANKQIIGRLRALSGKFNNEIDPAFVFLVCLDLAKHVEYLAKREQVFFEKQKTFKRINSECSLD